MVFCSYDSKKRYCFLFNDSKRHTLWFFCLFLSEPATISHVEGVKKVRKGFPVNKLDEQKERECRCHKIFAKRENFFVPAPLFLFTLCFTIYKYCKVILYGIVLYSNYTLFYSKLITFSLFLIAFSSLLGE